MLRYVILGLLRSGGRLHGYALMKECWRRSGVRISTGNFYRELARLASVGLVHPAQRPDGADARCMAYEISDAGRRAFDEWFCTQRASDFAKYDDELSTRAMFLEATDPKVGLRLVEEWREDLWIRNKRLEQARDGALRRSPATSVSGDFHAVGVLVSRRMQHLAADLRFVEDLRLALEQRLTGGRHEVSEKTPARVATRTSRRRQGARARRSSSATRR